MAFMASLPHMGEQGGLARAVVTDCQKLPVESVALRPEVGTKKLQGGISVVNLTFCIGISVFGFRTPLIRARCFAWNCRYTGGLLFTAQFSR